MRGIENLLTFRFKVENQFKSGRLLGLAEGLDSDKSRPGGYLNLSKFYRE